MECPAVLSNKLTHLQLAMMQEQERASRAERERDAALAERDAARSARTAHAEQMASWRASEQCETMQQLESLQALQRAVEVLLIGAALARGWGAQRSTGDPLTALPIELWVAVVMGHVVHRRSKPGGVGEGCKRVHVF